MIDMITNMLCVRMFQWATIHSFIDPRCGNESCTHRKFPVQIRIIMIGGVTGFLGSLKISPCEERRLKDTQNLKCEDRRFQNCLILKTEDLVTKPIKPED